MTVLLDRKICPPLHVVAEANFGARAPFPRARAFSSRITLYTALRLDTGPRDAENREDPAVELVFTTPRGLGRLTSWVASRDARRAVIFAPSRRRPGEGHLCGPGREARSAIIFAPLWVS